MLLPFKTEDRAYEYYHSYISDVEKSNARLTMIKNNSLSSVNYGPGILLSTLYTLSYLFGISIRREINRNNVQSVAFVLNRDCLQLFLFNCPDEKLGKKSRFILDSDNNCETLIQLPNLWV